LVGIFIVGFGIAPIFQRFVLAAAHDVISGNQVIASGWDILTTSPAQKDMLLGFFPVWVLYVVFGIAVVLPLILVRVNPTEMRPVYLCGEQSGPCDTDEYCAEADIKTKLTLGGYYFQDTLGEKTMNPVANTIAILLLILMIGCGVIPK
jgi:ech hydrogenase subunit A